MSSVKIFLFFNNTSAFLSQERSAESPRCCHHLESLGQSAPHSYD